MDTDHSGAPEPGTAQPASTTPDNTSTIPQPEPAIAKSRGAGRPLSITALAGILVLTGAGSDDRANWGTTVGLIAVGAASIAIIGLLSSAWIWLTTTSASRSTAVGSQPA